MGAMGCKCDWKKWIVASVIVAAVYAGLDYIIHHKLLINLYQANMHLWRTPQDTAAKMCWLWCGYLLFGTLFTCIYSKGYEPEKAGASQGLRFGFLVGLFYWGTHLMSAFPFHPWPTRLYQTWFACGLAEFALLGVLVGAIYKPKA
ncbi:MAG: hypothetical protein HYV03_03950 [Deltaproteobacteria bacterium]|nr:hypothetical protein [Deltaproteobacteria bacterium]